MCTEPLKTHFYSRLNNMIPNLCNLMCECEMFACTMGTIGAYNSKVIVPKNMILSKPSWMINEIRHLY